MNRYKIHLIPEAYNDLKEARKWYRSQNATLPKRLNSQIKITMEYLRSMPTAHTIRYNDVRIANIAIFPYAVHYIIENDTIIVLAVHHVAINPEKWTRRKRT